MADDPYVNGEGEALPWEAEGDGKKEDTVKIKKPEKVEEIPHHSEAPASLTVKVKSPAGFIYMWTLRDDHNSSLFFKLRAMEKKWLAEGFLPVEERSFGSKFASKPAAPLDYIPNRTCPKCGKRLINSKTKNGASMIKCETNIWNPRLKRAEGCDFVEWQDDYQNR